MDAAASDSKVVGRATAAARLAALHQGGATSVLTNGVFDLLHLGHVRYLQQARALGDLLVVGVNGDAAVRRLKGPQRPLVPAEERALLLAALECVGLVVLFDEETAEELVTALQPRLYTKGGDYDPAAAPGARGYLPEAAAVRRYGGRVVILPFVPAHSTTDLVERVLHRYAPDAGRHP